MDGHALGFASRKGSQDLELKMEQVKRPAAASQPTLNGTFNKLPNTLKTKLSDSCNLLYEIVRWKMCAFGTRAPTCYAGVCIDLGNVTHDILSLEVYDFTFVFH